MFRLSGIAVVTAGLAGSGLAHVVWNWDTTPLRALTRSVALPDAAPDLGSGFVLHSGAWRTFPLAEATSPEVTTPLAQQAIAPAPAELAAPAGLATSEPPTQAPAAVGAAPWTSETIREAPLPPILKPAAAEPAVLQKVAPSLGAPAQERPPAPHERMSLAGPRAELLRKANAGDVAPHALRAGLIGRGPAPEPDNTAAPVAAPKFGPEIFKRLEGLGY